MDLDTGFIIQMIIQVTTIVFTVGGVTKLILYRLDRLEEKQDKHNKLIERMFYVEQSTKSAHKRLDDVCDDVDEIRKMKMGVN
ncbi:MAG: hypothetical protein ACOCRO_05370 [Halanaerobiales bacterium]